MADVEIKIEADDNASGTIREIRANLQGMSEDAKQLDADTKTLSGDGGGLGQTKEQLSQISELAKAQALQDIGASLTSAFQNISGAVKGVAAEYDAYVEQTKKVALMTGTTTEEASRLIQVADDARVNYSELTSAMRIAAQKGIQPNIEGLAKLADQYTALKSPTERAAFASSMFGRNWVGISRLLEMGGDAIRKNAAAVDASLIIDQKKEEQARALFVATDDLDDAMFGLKLTLAQELTPALIESTKWISANLVPALKSAMEWFNALPTGVKNTILGIGTFGVAVMAIGGPLLSMAGMLKAIGVTLGIGASGGGLAAAFAGLAKAIGFAETASSSLLVTLGRFAPIAAILIEVFTILKNITAYLQGTPMPGQGGIYWNNGKPTLQMPARATGGSVRAGQSYLVGERGPELFKPSQSGTVLPNSALAGVGGTNVTIQLAYNPMVSTASQDELIYALRPAVDSILRKR